jgi:hypothetical protein
MTRTGLTGIVWRSDATQAWYIPVVRAYGHRHRAEVAIGAAWAALGASVRDPVAECQKMHVKRLEALTKIGVTPETLLASVIASVTREIKTRGDEDRMQFSPRSALAVLYA